MSFADAIAVNSGFTKGVVSKVWPQLAAQRVLEIVYPCVDVKEKKPDEEADETLTWRDTDILLSINRFEAKKDVGLAIRAYAGLGKHGRKGVRLVVAGEFWRLMLLFVLHLGTNLSQAVTTTACKKMSPTIKSF